MPLLRLDATRERILKQAAQDMQNRMPGLTGGAAQSGNNNPPTFKTREEYEAYQARVESGIIKHPKNLGEYFNTMNNLSGQGQQFKSRDEYFS